MKPRKLSAQHLRPEIEAEREAIERPCDPRQYRVFSKMAHNPDNRLIISFGGGSVPAVAGNIALAGIIEELELRPLVREIWGTSAGAIVGAGWASGRTAGEILETLKLMNWAGIVDFSLAEIAGRGALKMMRMAGLPDGFIGGRHFRQYIEGGLKAKTFEECVTPLRIIACTDDGRARKVIFRQGSLINAVMASMCLPGIMKPVRDWNGEPHGYFDGGVVEKTPLPSIIDEHARQLRPEQLLIVCTHYTYLQQLAQPTGFLMRFWSTALYMEDQVWAAQLAQSGRQAGCKAVVLSPQELTGGSFDFAHTVNNYLTARKYYKEQLSNAHLAKHFNSA